ncbi:26S proteasome complex subunit [Ophidiomyces ophidiicola]|uniref:26S proteasome complex subunit n=1 Tax=Ophidiomyces ophidiicola TaxID=1387563 RepID=A0ACB8UVP7_9EURO|nr:26S proteasome complex subunit [Ophidiomyces ophidiicola]KAI1913523.1 26S proteasome complex subunit [Ophidiomyces ophidiicola]KAI1914582.1 26S proteasome complex subunit [Ophidiomyces ophidiicola]KAI1925349.1 26S proteasome complex subunit [Ophidiomyces ophidiicola]KAI1930246.1 26S proteasome complex subunit [Ophidiomyces ophidiicola]KAI1938462.1 26S proteasome complex subunit [Ophidiomyces ophidiicola]
MSQLPAGGPASNTPSDEKPAQATKAPAALEEDDEFEDFPVEDWPQEDAEALGPAGTNDHLWEESWDDDDNNEEFSKQLREELKKVEAVKQ